MENTALKRFGAALTDWAASDSRLLALTGHTAANQRIWVYGGNDPIAIPCLLFDIQRTMPYHPDVDSIMWSMVYAVAIGKNRLKALEMIGRVIKMASPSTATYKDTAFESNSIKSRGMEIAALLKQGESEFDITSVRRTERSDTPIPERNVALVSLYITWMDTS